MKRIVMVVMACLLCNVAVAGVDWTVTVVPTENLDGGMAVFTFTADNPKIAEAEAVGGEAESGVLAAIGNHFAENWKPWSLGTLATAGLVLIGENNDWFHHDKDSKDAVAIPDKTPSLVTLGSLEGKDNGVEVNVKYPQGSGTPSVYVGSVSGEGNRLTINIEEYVPESSSTEAGQ